MAQHISISYNAQKTQKSCMKVMILFVLEMIINAIVDYKTYPLPLSS